MDKRLRILEETVITYGRRHDDCENERRLMQAHIKSMLEWRETIAESTEVNREMVEVGKALLKTLGWVKVVAKWIISVGTACAIVMGLAKYVLNFGGRI